MVSINKEMVPESVWLEAYIAYISSSNSICKEKAKEWADECLKDFKERFQQPSPDKVGDGS